MTAASLSKQRPAARKIWRLRCYGYARPVTRWVAELPGLRELEPDLGPWAACWVEHKAWWKLRAAFVRDAASSDDLEEALRHGWVALMEEWLPVYRQAESTLEQAAHFVFQRGMDYMRSTLADRKRQATKAHHVAASAYGADPAEVAERTRARRVGRHLEGRRKSIIERLPVLEREVFEAMQRGEPIAETACRLNIGHGRVKWLREKARRLFAAEWRAEEVALYKSDPDANLFLGDWRWNPSLTE